MSWTSPLTVPMTIVPFDPVESSASMKPSR